MRKLMESEGLWLHNLKIDLPPDPDMDPDSTGLWNLAFIHSEIRGTPLYAGIPKLFTDLEF